MREHGTTLRDLVITGLRREIDQRRHRPRAHDARIAAICLAHGVDAPWSADRDSGWFPTLRVVNPLVDAG